MIARWPGFRRWKVVSVPVAVMMGLSLVWAWRGAVERRRMLEWLSAHSVRHHRGAECWLKLSDEPPSWLDRLFALGSPSKIEEQQAPPQPTSLVPAQLAQDSTFVIQGCTQEELARVQRAFPATRVSWHGVNGDRNDNATRNVVLSAAKTVEELGQERLKAAEGGWDSLMVSFGEAETYSFADYYDASCLLRDAKLALATDHAQRIAASRAAA